METEYQPRMIQRRTFWAVFVCAWGAYGLLYCSTALLEGATLGRAIVVALAVVGSQATPALVVVWCRAFLFRVERPLHRTVGLNVLAGLL